MQKRVTVQTGLYNPCDRSYKEQGQHLNCCKKAAQEREMQC